MTSAQLAEAIRREIPATTQADTEAARSRQAARLRELAEVGDTAESVGGLPGDAGKYLRSLAELLEVTWDRKAAVSGLELCAEVLEGVSQVEERKRRSAAT